MASEIDASSENARYVELTLKYEHEEGMWVGICLELSTSTDEETLAEALVALPQLVMEHLELLAESNELQRFFNEHGIQLHATNPLPTLIPTPAIDFSGDEPGVLFQPGVFPIPPRRSTAAHG